MPRFYCGLIYGISPNACIGDLIPSIEGAEGVFEITGWTRRGSFSGHAFDEFTLIDSRGNSFRGFVGR